MVPKVCEKNDIVMTGPQKGGIRREMFRRVFEERRKTAAQNNALPVFKHRVQIRGFPNKEKGFCDVAGEKKTVL